MRPPFSRTIFLGLVLIILATFIASCSDDTDGPLPDCETLDAMLALARTSLEDELYTHLRQGAADPATPDDVDFSVARGLYREAHECDADDVTARFGLAVCELLSLSVDPSVNEAFDDWEAYLDENTPFARPSKNAERRLGVPLGMPTGAGALDLPFDLVRCTALAQLKMAMNGVEPQITGVQRILLDVVLPRAESVIGLLGPVVADENFTFIVSGRMQGDPYEDPVEIDRTDVLALSAACKVLLAGIHTAVAYDVQFPSYDEAGLLAGLDRADGNLLRLRTGGAAHMQQVPALFVTAVDELDDAIDLLFAETDDQDDDAIRIGPDSVSEQDLLDIQNDWLPEVRESFGNNGGTVHTENWDSDWETPEVPLVIDLYSFFTDPIEDWKLVLPAYTLDTAVRPWSGYDGNHVDDTIGPIQVYVPLGYTGYSRYYSVGFYDFVSSYHYDDGVFPDFLAACDEYIEDAMVSVRANPDWTGYAYFSFGNYGTLTPGTTVPITIDVYTSYETAETFVYVPVVTWGATTYAQWLDQWTNPTLNGLLPGMQDASDIAAVFGFTENRWEQSFVWDWTDMDTDPPVVPGL
jgi:hypothetical protein